MFIYKKSIFDINNEYRQTYETSDKDEEIIREIKKFTEIFDKIYYSIIQKEGALFFGIDGTFAPWVGTIMSPNSNMIIICNSNEEREAISRLARVGYEKIIGFMCGVDEWKKDKRNLDNIVSISPKEILSHIKNSIKILDVRGQDELKLGFVKNSIHIPVQALENSLNEIEISENYLVYCGSGYRSMIACSILKSKGFNNIKNIYGGFNAISQNIDISSLII